MSRVGGGVGDGGEESRSQACGGWKRPCANPERTWGTQVRGWRLSEQGSQQPGAPAVSLPGGGRASEGKQRL